MRRPVILHRADWAPDPRLWRGAVEGARLGTGLTVLFYSTETIGDGPKLHLHPYDEVFIVRSGRALYTIGDERIEAIEGDVLTGPAEVPHKFHNLGPGLLDTVDIHLSERWIQTDLVDPDGG